MTTTVCWLYLGWQYGGGEEVLLCFSDGPKERGETCSKGPKKGKFFGFLDPVA